MPNDDGAVIRRELLRAQAADAVAERKALAAVQNRLFGRTSSPPELARYRLLGEIGSGGCGVVYRAHDPELNRDVAVKLVRAQGVDSSSVDHQRRLVREGQALARIAHPNVVDVFDVGTFATEHEAVGVFVVMELIDGMDLRAWLRDGRQPWAEVLQAFVAAGRGLAAAHAEGLIHRDFKPSNVLRGLDGRIRVVDFGLARLGDAIPTTEPSATGLLTDEITRTGQTLGTPAYMAPEVALRRPATAASDQYSFCVALFEALYGFRPPARIGDVKQLPRPPADCTVPGRVYDALEIGLRREPNERHTSMKALLGILDRTSGGRRPWVTVAIAGTAALGALLWLRARADSRSAEPCEQGRARVAAVWNDSQRAGIAESFRVAGSAISSEIWARAEPRIHAYARAWSELHASICAATHVSQTQAPELLDIRMACMNERLRGVAALLDVLQEANATVVEGTIAAVAQLPALEPCADARQVGQTMPPPEPTTADAVDELRTQLARAQAWQDVGSHANSLEVAEAVFERAAEIGYLPVQAAAQQRLGRAQLGLGDLDSATSTLDQAYWTALEANDDATALEAAIALTAASGLYRHDHARGLEWGRHAEAILDRSDGAAPNRARVAHLRGLIALERGDIAGARRSLEHALELQSGPQGNEMEVAKAEIALANTVANDQPREAIAAYSRGLSTLESLFGPQDARLTVPLIQLGKAHRILGEVDHARTRVERALALAERTLVTDRRMMAIALRAMGEILTDAGELEPALAHFERAAAFQRGDGVQHALALAGLGRAQTATGDCESADKNLSAAVGVLERALGSRHQTLVTPLAEIGRCHLRAGRSALALGYLRRALAVCEQSSSQFRPCAEISASISSASR